MERQTDGETYRWRDRQTDGETDRRRDRQMERQTVMTKLIAAFRNFANAPKTVTAKENKPFFFTK